MNCPDCGAPNPEETQLCGGCGRSLFFYAPGTVLSDRYEIQEVLGSGGLGRVYRARDRMLEETVAVKVLHPEASRSHEFARRFRSEIKLARKVRHRNVCAIHEYGEEGSLRFVAMELVEGRDLHQVLRERGPFPAAEAFDVAVQVAEGLAAIHDAGVVHRDLKTPNIMLDRAGVVRLLDFGIAKLMAPTGTLALTAIQKVVGTPEYMSPEQIRGEELDARSDLYSLGIVLFELFTGLVPFQGKTPVDTLLRQVNEPPPLYGDMAARVPRELVPLLARTLSKRPEDRPASARAFLEALRAARRAVFPKAPPTPLPLPDLGSRQSTPPPRPRGGPDASSPVLTPPPLPPPVQRTAVLPRRRTGPSPGRGTPPTPIEPPPITPRPPTRTAREDAAAAALDAGRTYVELPASPPPTTPRTPTEMGRPPALPVAGRRTIAARLRRRPILWGAAAVLGALLASWLAFRAGTSAPDQRVSRPTWPSLPPVTPPADATPPAAGTPALAESPTPWPSTASTPLPSLVPAPTPEVPTTPSPAPRPPRRSAPTAPPPTPTPSPSPTPTPEVALLDLVVNPWADVMAGEQGLGRTPLEGLALAPGPVVLLMQHPDYWPLRRRLVLEPGHRTRIQIDLPWEAVARGKVPPYQVPPGEMPQDAYFLPGVRLLAEADFHEAVIMLDPVVRRLEAQGRPKQLARAEFVLGVALLELGREVEARARFESALGHDDSLRPHPDAFPARVKTFFGHVREALKARKR